MFAKGSLGFGDTNPDGLGAAFSAAHTPSMGPSPGDAGWSGFGPGDYSGGYTGQGDTVYWGPTGDGPVQPMPPAVLNSNTQNHFGPTGVSPAAPTAVVQAAAVRASTVSGSSTGWVDPTPSTSTSGTSGVASGSSGTGGTMGRASSGIQSTPTLPAAGSARSAMSDTFTTLRSVADRTATSSGTSGVASGSSGTDGTGGGGGGSIELQDLGPKKLTTREIFEKYYVEGDTFDPQVAVEIEYGIDTAEANVTYQHLQDDLMDMWSYEQDFHGDSWGGGDDGGGGEWGPDLPGEADTFGGGEIEMQVLGGKSTASTAPSFVDSDLQKVTPFDDGRSVALTKDGSPVYLNDVPESEAFSWDTIDLESASPEAQAMLAETFSDPSTMSLGAEGIGTSLSGIKGFVRNRLIDVVGGQLLMPMFNWLDGITGNPWASRVIQGSLASFGLVAAGDPFGVIAAPICWGIQEYMKQRQRLLANDDPEADRGRKFGYVREGDKWYPAIQTSKERDEGWIGSTKTQVSFQYGENIQWRKAKGSTEWIPYFEKGTYRMKNFHVMDSEVDDTSREGGEDYQKRVDPLRDFYYLSEEETLAYLHGVSGGDAAAGTHTGSEFTDEDQASIKKAQTDAFGGFGVKNDVGWNDYWNSHSHEEAQEYTKRGAYVDQLQDIRKSLEFMQGYRYSEPGSLESEDFGMNEYEGSRQFRQTVNENNYLGNAIWNRERGDATKVDLSGRGGVGTTSRGSGDRDNTYVIKDLSGRLEGDTAEEIAKAGATSFQNSKEMRWLTDEFYRQRDLLYKTQKAAGTSMGFKDKYGHAHPDYKPSWYTGKEGEFTDSASTYEAFQDDPKAFQNLQNSAWSLYQDGTWDFGDLDTTDQLHAAIEKIEASGEGEHRGTEHYRNEDQRSYLAQKAYCRYLFSKVNQLGGMDYMREFGGKRDTAFGNTEFRNQDEERYGGDYSIMGGLGWSLDPMYSEIDDKDLLNGSYGIKNINHRDEYVAEDTALYGQDGDNLRQLVEAGVIGQGKDSPDYVAGRFESVAQFNDVIGTGSDLPWDEVQGTFVPWGKQTKDSVYDPDKDTFTAPAGWVDPSTVEKEAAATAVETPEEAAAAVEKAASGRSETIEGDWGHATSDDPLSPYEIPGPGWTWDPMNRFMVAPDGTPFDPNYIPDLNKMYELEKELQAGRDADKDAQAAADKEAAAQDAEDDAAAAAKKSVPDVDPVGTHIHDHPAYVPEHHEIQHFQSDATATALGHIPLPMIAHQISEGLKVV